MTVGYKTCGRVSVGCFKHATKSWLQVQDLEDAAARVGKSVAKLGREIKHWPAWQSLRDRIDAFKRTMPLVSDLRNPAMRPRHWRELMQTIGSRFDPASDDFTLDSIVQLRLDKHAEFIGELSTNATKELAIEQSLAAIADAWKQLTLDLVRTLECYCQIHECRSTVLLTKHFCIYGASIVFILFKL